MNKIKYLKSNFIDLKEMLRNGLFLVSLFIFIQLIGCRSNNDTEKSKEKSAFSNPGKFLEKNKTKNFHNKNSTALIPEKAYKIRDYVRENGIAKPRYVGGRKFKNLEKRLPIFDNNHLKINYQEWDINKKTQGKNRGAERLVTGSDGTDYYTNDHYKSFQKLKEKE